MIRRPPYEVVLSKRFPELKVIIWNIHGCFRIPFTCQYIGLCALVCLPFLVASMKKSSSSLCSSSMKMPRCPCVRCTHSIYLLAGAQSIAACRGCSWRGVWSQGEDTGPCMGQCAVRREGRKERRREGESEGPFENLGFWKCFYSLFSKCVAAGKSVRQWRFKTSGFHLKSNSPERKVPIAWSSERGGGRGPQRG